MTLHEASTPCSTTGKLNNDLTVVGIEETRPNSGKLNQITYSYERLVDHATKKPKVSRLPPNILVLKTPSICMVLSHSR